MNPFDAIIANLEAKGAFTPVLDVAGLYPGYTHKITRSSKQNTVIHHRSKIVGMDIYMPMKDVMQFSRSWIMKAVTERFPRSMMEAFKQQLKAIYLDDDYRQEYVSRGYQERELHREPGYDILSKKCGKQEKDFIAEMFQHHPALFASVVMMQVVNVAFLDKLGEALNKSKALSPEKYEIAKAAITALSDDFMGGEFLEGPALWVALAYHDRITQNRTIAPDYSLPITQDDFAKGWNATLNKGGMLVNKAEVYAGGNNVRVCPWLNRAKTTSAELCVVDTEDGGMRMKGMGFGSWCVYQQLNTPEALHLHARDYKRLKNPKWVKGSRQLSFKRLFAVLTRS